MKKRIIEFIKFNKAAKNIYKLFMETIIYILKQFIKPNDNLILFVSYGGKSFDDSPRVIYDELIKDEYFSNYEFVWAFLNPYDFTEYNLETVRIDSLKYYITALKSRVWITNASIERGLFFKGKKTFYLNTWHGTPIKKMGEDLKKLDSTKRKKSKVLTPNYDVFCVQGEYESKIFQRSFNMEKRVVKNTGLPRNDILTKYNSKQTDNIKKKLGLSNKKVILYAPTFRNYGREENKFNFKVNINFEKWSKSLPKNHVLLIRNHYEIQKEIELSFINIIDVSNYKKLSDLMLISDVLITDYSSIMFDYAILKRPILCYAYDLEQYIGHRGLYIDLLDIFEKNYTYEDELLIDIVNNNYQIDAYESILNSFVDYYGEAANKTKELIKDELAR